VWEKHAFLIIRFEILWLYRLAVQEEDCHLGLQKLERKWRIVWSHWNEKAIFFVQ
jgi:hypothetical protein